MISFQVQEIDCPKINLTKGNDLLLRDLIKNNYKYNINLEYMYKIFYFCKSIYQPNLVQL